MQRWRVSYKNYEFWFTILASSYNYMSMNRLFKNNRIRRRNRVNLVVLDLMEIMMPMKMNEFVRENNEVND